MKGSQSRKVKFVECVQLCNLDTKKGLRQDVPTRWNSTFFMLESALYYKNAFVHLQMSDSNFKHCPNFDEWVKVENICKFLQVFNDITSIFSGNKYPTANLYFPLIFAAHVTLNEFMDSKDEYMKSMSKKMFEKFNKYWGEYSRILALVVLDPKYKLSFVEWYYKKLYGDEGLAEAEKVKNTLFASYSEHINVGNKHSDGINHGATTTESSFMSTMDGNASFSKDLFQVINSYYLY